MCYLLSTCLLCGRAFEECLLGLNKYLWKEDREGEILVVSCISPPLLILWTLYILKLADLPTHSSCCTELTNKNNFKPTECPLFSFLLRSNHIIT